MMTSYPTKIRVSGKLFPIDTNYKTALKCLELVDDPDIGDMERTEAIAFLLLGFVPKLSSIGKYIKPIKKYLECGKSGNGTVVSEPDMDFAQDETYIKASFRSDYGIDLSKENMHWWQFMELVNGLTPDCILSRVRQIRNDDPKSYTGKYREELIQAQKTLALKKKLSKEERQSEDEFEKWLGGADNVRQ